MPNLKSVKPEVVNYELSLTNTELSVGDTVQETPNGQQEVGLNLKRSSAMRVMAVNRKINPMFAIVTYRPTIFGPLNAKRIITAFSDYYNKIVGSALTSNTISTADLVLFTWLAKEWRALVKDIDRALTIYNQVVYMNDAYGRDLFDAIYGRGAYVVISTYSLLFTKFRNQLATRINTYFPMMKGLKWTAIDDLALDNIYADDPSEKSALVAFRREGFCISKTNGILAKFESLNFWKKFRNSVTGDDYNASNFIAFTDYILDLFDDLVHDVWYTDVRPYVQHLIDKGGFAEDAGINEMFESKNANREWKPVYSTDVIDLLKNSHILAFYDYMVEEYGHTTDPVEMPIPHPEEEDIWGPSIEESARGLVVSNHPIFSETPDARIAVDTRFKNLGEYPATNQALTKAIALDAITVPDDITTRIEASGPALITLMELYYKRMSNNEDANSEMILDKILLTSNFVFSLPVGVTYNYYENTEYVMFATATCVIHAELMPILSYFNIVPQLLIMCPGNDLDPDSPINSADLSDMLHQDYGGSITAFNVDVDHVIKLSDEFYSNAYRLMAYDCVYNPDSIKGVAGK